MHEQSQRAADLHPEEKRNRTTPPLWSSSSSSPSWLGHSIIQNSDKATIRFLFYFRGTDAQIRVGSPSPSPSGSCLSPVHDVVAAPARVRVASTDGVKSCCPPSRRRARRATAAHLPRHRVPRARLRCDGEGPRRRIRRLGARPSRPTARRNHRGLGRPTRHGFADAPTAAARAPQRPNGEALPVSDTPSACHAAAHGPPHPLTPPPPPPVRAHPCSHRRSLSTARSRLCEGRGGGRRRFDPTTQPSPTSLPSRR